MVERSGAEGAVVAGVEQGGALRLERRDAVAVRARGRRGQQRLDPLVLAGVLALARRVGVSASRRRTRVTKRSTPASGRPRERRTIFSSSSGSAASTCVCHSVRRGRKRSPRRARRPSSTSSGPT